VPARPPASYGYAGGGARVPGASAVGLTKADFDIFEHGLTDVTLAYGAPTSPSAHAGDAGDGHYFAAIGRLCQPRSDQRLSDIKLLQGDLAEAWREGDADYATLAMRYSLTDAMVERDSGRVVEGSRSPQEVTELWTFRRQRGGEWLLAAIQQVR
jgi:hypothetical protein